MRPNLDQLKSRLNVDAERGLVYWVDATKYHPNLAGEEAGFPRPTASGKHYWWIKVDGVAINRSHIVFLFHTGRWPVDLIDHANGDSLDDRIANLREATVHQNAQNHKRRSKKSRTPMGVRKIPSGRYQARITFFGRLISIGSFDTEEQAQIAYRQKRKELFNEFA